MVKKKEHPLTAIFASMRQEEDQAEIDYIRIKEEDQNKTYLDILPPEFRDFKRSIIKKQILHYVDRTTEVLNQNKVFKNRLFDRIDVVRYMMQGEKYSNFYLAHKFIPRVPDLWMDYAMNFREENNRAKPNYEVFKKENDKKIDEHEELKHLLALLTQTWEQYEEKLKIKKGELVHSYDIEKDGFPRCGRGNMCYLFTPIKGKWSKDFKDELRLFNPRNKKHVVYTDLEYKAEDNIYRCKNEKGKTVFLAEHQEIEDAYDALFPSNKETYSGWWNKTMIIK